MSARRLSGRDLAKSKEPRLKTEAEVFRARCGRAPRLAVALASGDGAALAYAEAKRRAADKVGIDVELVRLHNPTTVALVRQVEQWGSSDLMDGILIESPVAPGVDLRAAQDAIPEAKDVDGASVLSLGRLFSGRPQFIPGTAAAVIALLEEHHVPVAGRRAVVVGRSLVVGRPLAELLLKRDATVTVCHSQTRDLGAVTRDADLVCVAVGKPRFLTGSMVKPGAVVIDVGTNQVDGKTVGDVDVDSVAAVAEAISPVPGGVGPLTTVLLLENVVRAARERAER